MSAFILMAKYHWNQNSDSLTESDKKDLLNELWFESPGELTWMDYTMSFEDISDKCLQLFVSQVKDEELGCDWED